MKQRNLYKNWYNKQDGDFKKEINPNDLAVERFIDYNKKGIDLDELKQYDKKYCNHRDDENAY